MEKSFYKFDNLKTNLNHIYFRTQKINNSYSGGASEDCVADEDSETETGINTIC